MEQLDAKVAAHAATLAQMHARLGDIYVTATLATFFIGRDAAHEAAEAAGATSIAALQAEIAALRDEIRALDK